jgi:hypothetical protein
MKVIDNKYYKQCQELAKTPRYGISLTCPGCGGEEFYIYRNNIDTPALIDDPKGDSNNNNNNNNSKSYEMVKCKNSECHIDI